ncbi:zinc metalloprotease HtpX [Sulfurisphaera ohwakuensis]|uniref:Protease HtpX homolog n=1 Tax=Sulfurisphaera ohwakuensis TaxID=69656 RepID=A0A650CFJ7_SULOH|nr:zinc metalloprotease HtpX [Sulfurisphaera ohwakuensis]MBB5254916.1 heat shock protein HtpX [Sulfurisphaera ohwakuensis]QGR16594.1 M48 family metalloprotease [Sulfurisphaera ohwakuensis]
MEIGTSLKINMIVALFLTIISEGIFSLVIIDFLKFPVVFSIIFLLILWLVQWLISPYLVERNSVEVTRDDPSYGWVYDLIESVARRAGIKTPRVFLVDEPYPNAFAYGNYITGKRIGITIPLLQILTPEELESVIGHELGHIKHNDVEIGLAIGLIPSILGFISNILLTVGWATLIFAVDEFDILVGLTMLAIGGILFIITFFLQLFVLWFNRLRESFADYFSYELFRERAWNLAKALAKIEIYMQNVRLDPFRGIIVTIPPTKVKESDPDLLIEDLLREKTSIFSDILSTHPHPAKRIKMIYKLTKPMIF